MIGTRLTRTVLCMLAACALAAASGPAGATEPGARIALVIGNSAYENSPLLNPVNDARLMARTLKGLGFQVTQLLDADQKTMKKAVRDFGAALERHGRDTVGLFYFAGHGIQVRGENFLVPVNAPIHREADVSIEAVSAGAVLDQIGFARNRLNIVILDACRNNPFKRSFRAANPGLARMDAPTGTLVAYSTAPGSVAQDGAGENSPYSAALARAMQRPGSRIEDVFKQTRRQVMAATAQTQVPWESSSLIDDFYFAGPPQAIASVPPFALPQPAEPVPATPRPVAAPPAAAPPDAAVPAPSAEPASIADGDVFRDCPDCPEMVAIPAGRFHMGSPAREPGRAADEGPVREVNLHRFAIGKYEVTRGEFAAFVRETGYNAGGGCWYWSLIFIFDPARSWRNPGYPQTDRHPVACMNWGDARAYTLWLSQKTGKTYRLPTEAEWEYAARAGSTAAYYWGEDPNAACTYENVYDRVGAAGFHFPWAHADCDDGFKTSAPVGSFKPNGFGLHDMLGNAPEWVADCFLATYDLASTDGSAQGTADCQKRVIRGGAWPLAPSFSRAASRRADEPWDRADIYGFRIAREMD